MSVSLIQSLSLVSGRTLAAVDRAAEMGLWTLVAFASAWRAVVALPRSQSPEHFMGEYYLQVAFGTMILMFPVLFRLVYGRLPVEMLRRGIARARVRRRMMEERESWGRKYPQPEDAGTPGDASATTTTTTITATLPHLGEVSFGTRTHAPNKPQYLTDLAAGSRRLAADVYRRALTYMFVGVFVAFSGLVFFYAMTGGNTTSVAELATADLIRMVPKVGILFFIEFVAFFFLRQYRAAMEDFRYYEAVARFREEVAVLMNAAASSGTPAKAMDLIKYDAYFSRAGVLQKGQTSELVESKRLERSELDLFEKIIDSVSKRR